MPETILDQNLPDVDPEGEEDESTLAAIDRGIQAAAEGRTVALEDVRKMIPKWISKFDSQNRP
ncbi:MAG: hypothetical protein ABI824_05665 [Acidobacteriota bacterium]